MNSGSSPMCHGAIQDYMHYEWHHTHMQSRYLLAHMVQRHSMTTGLGCLLEDRREVLLELQHLKILIVLAAERIKQCP